MAALLPAPSPTIQRGPPRSSPRAAYRMNSATSSVYREVGLRAWRACRVIETRGMSRHTDGVSSSTTAIASSFRPKAGRSAPPTWDGMLLRSAAVTNVERGRSNPLYEFFKSGVALWGRRHQRAVDAAWREAHTNPDMARTISSALGLKKPTPMQLSKMHA
jgi:hypothetical protein